jgi:hypothetical protein
MNFNVSALKDGIKVNQFQEISAFPRLGGDNHENAEGRRAMQYAREQVEKD